MKPSHATLPSALRALARPALKLASDYGWTCPLWARYAGCSDRLLNDLLQGYPSDMDASRRIVETTGLYLLEQVGEPGGPVELLVGWRMPAHPLGAAPTTLECHACRKTWTLLPHRGDGRIRCRSCAAERWIGEPYLEQLLPNVAAAFSAMNPMPA